MRTRSAVAAAVRLASRPLIAFWARLMRRSNLRSRSRRSRSQRCCSAEPPSRDSTIHDRGAFTGHLRSGGAPAAALNCCRLVVSGDWTLLPPGGASQVLPRASRSADFPVGVLSMARMQSFPSTKARFARRPKSSSSNPKVLPEGVPLKFNLRTRSPFGWSIRARRDLGPTSSWCVRWQKGPTGPLWRSTGSCCTWMRGASGLAESRNLRIGPKGFWSSSSPSAKTKSMSQGGRVARSTSTLSAK